MTQNIKDLKIECSKFISLTTTSNGSAICIQLQLSNLPLYILSSTFYDCSASLEGGAVYLINCETNFLNNNFDSCYSKQNKNELHGNAIYNYQSASNINETSFYLCGPDTQRKSDSCVYMNGNKFISYESNGTNNYGIGGAGLFCFWYTFDGTFVKFTQVYKCFDYRFIEIISSEFTTSFCNFIDASKQTDILWISGKVPIFEDCIFINITGKKIAGGGTSVFTRCISNDNYSGMIFSSSPSTYEIILGVNNCIFYNCSKKNDNKCLLLSNIFLYIFILI